MNVKTLTIALATAAATLATSVAHADEPRRC